MAKLHVPKSGTSRIRFIMLEAEISEGNLGEVTSAIQNALKPATTFIQQRLTTSRSAPNEVSGSTTSEADIGEDEEELEVGEGLDPPTVRPTREPRPRKPTSMEVLELDLKTGVSLEDFVERHTPKNDVERNLVTLAWFKENRPDEKVTANHVYTCYRAMKWPAGIEDFGSPLRKLKHKQLVKSPARGQYEINHIGLDRVLELASPR